MTTHPLAGKRIVITRPPHQADVLANRLRELGAEPVLLPTITIQPPRDLAPLDDALRHVDHYDWLILTSANAVTTIVQRLTALNLDPVWPAVAVIDQVRAIAKQRLEERIESASASDVSAAVAALARILEIP